MTVLPDGTVLLAFGRNENGDLSSTLICLPGENRFHSGPATIIPPGADTRRCGLAGDGNVLIGGSSGCAATP